MNQNVFIINSSQGLLDAIKPLFSNVYFSKKINKTFYLFVSKLEIEEVFHFSLPEDKVAAFFFLHILYLVSFIKIINKVDVIVFSQIPDYPLSVLFLGKFANKKIVDFIGGSRFFLSQTVLYSHTNFLQKIASVYGIISLECSLRFSDRIVLITDSILCDNPFNKFRQKTKHGLNFPTKTFYDKFKIKKDYKQRDLIIGYIGKFTLAKGVYNFALAVKNLLSLNGLLILFVGDYLNSEPSNLGLNLKHMFNNNDKVIFTGAVPHEKVSYYLNEMKLLVLPSYSEGLPHIILEAMACGTPALATPVGAIPHIVKNGENGFLLESNDPKHIAKKIIELLGKPELLEKVSFNSYRYISENFSYEKTLNIWREIFSEFNSIPQKVHRET